jgi:hypothetical protein
MASLIAASAQNATRTPSKKDTPKPRFHYWHNWTDDKGVSHMTKCPILNFELKSMSPPADPQWQARQASAQSQVILTQQPAGWKGAWHEDPKVQWIVPLRGTWFVEAMDGTRVELGPGDVSVGEDQNTKPDAKGRKGHLSGNVSSGPIMLMVIQLEETPTVNQPCRFK